jgi:hypothetical protein
MRTSIAWTIVVGLVALALPASGLGQGATVPGADVGVFAGTVEQGTNETHTYDNDPLAQPCAQVLVPYTAHLVYQPVTDRLSLTVEHGDESTTVEAEAGYARVTFHANLCTSLDLEVTGLDVADQVAYTLVVERASCPALAPVCASS